MKGYLLDEEDLEIAMKVVIVGNGSVGKSSMIQRFCRGVFTRDYKKTIGVDFLERVIKIDNQNIRLMLWDTAGQEEFDAITRTYYRGASACVLACSITDRNSFNALPAWKTKVCRECGDDLPMVLVANKYDLQKQAVVDSSSLDAMARSLGITKVFKTSVKEDLNVLTVFTHLAQEYFNSVMALDDMTPSTDLIEGDAFLTSIDTHLVVEDKPHHKFHTPIFGNFRTNNNNLINKNSNNNSKSSKFKFMGKAVSTKSENGSSLKTEDNKSSSMSPLGNCRNPVILKSQQALGELPKIKGLLSPSSPKKNNIHTYQRIGSSDQYNNFSSSGNHYTHWDNNMPFRLDVISDGNHFKKPKKDFCTIL